MPPNKALPKQLGNVQRNGDGWRMFANIDHNNCVGPTRPLQSQAQRDLARAQHCKTRADMQRFIQNLHGRQPLAGPAAVMREVVQGSSQSMDGAQPLAGISSVTGESSGRPAAMHQSAASSTGRSEPGSASSAANLRRAPRSLKGGRSAAEKRQDRFKHRRVYQTTESYKAKRRLREKWGKVSLCQEREKNVS